jgi:hypothetical protein
MNNRQEAKNPTDATHNEETHTPTTFFTGGHPGDLRAEGERRLQQ